MSFNYGLDFINIIILVYLMIDAPKYGKNSILWGILGFFFGTIVLTVYLFMTGRKKWAWVWLVITILYILALAGVLVFILRMMHFGP